MQRKILIICSLIVFLGLFNTGCTKNTKLFAGRITKGDEKGLSVFEFNSRTGSLKPVSENDVGPSPSYFCFSKKHRMIYAANEVLNFKGESGGGLTTLKYDAQNGTITKINETLIPYGGPCYISMSADNGYLFIANYTNGSVAVVKLDNNGLPVSISDTILFVKDEADRSHAHMIINDPAGKHVYVSDLGLDRIVIFDFDTNSGKLNPVNNGIFNLPKGSGPRHFAFNSDGSKMYLINEPGSTVMVFNVNDRNGLELIQTLPTIRKGFNEINYCADIHLGKDGNFLYGSNRGENTIVTFRIGSDGLLTLAGHNSCGGDWPRNFVIDPTGRFLLVANQKSGDISVFKINRKTGIPADSVYSLKVPVVACLKFWSTL